MLWLQPATSDHALTLYSVIPRPQHDAQLDYYGKRLATCSSDRTVRVYDVASAAAEEGGDSANTGLVGGMSVKGGERGGVVLRG